MTSDSSLPPVNEKFANALAFIEEITNNTESQQLKVLSEILAQNASTEYLQRFNLGGSTDRDSFKSRVPVVTYEDLLPDIQRIANGDRSPILCSHPISEFFMSSGTSAGERKLIPTTREDQERRQLFTSFLMPVINQYIPGLNKGKFLNFLFITAETKTPSGLVAHQVSTSYCKTKQFKNNNNHTSPDEAILCEDSFQSMYTQILCGLIMRHEVLRVGTLSPPCLLRAIKFLQLNWRQLAHDISTGTLNPKITDASIQSRMAQILKPNPELAHFLIKECEGENWECIIPRIWPNTKYLEVVVTGAMAQYVPLLDFYSGGLHKASMIYATSECYIGLNLNPMAQPSEVSYTIMPNMAYFEFIPHDPAKDDLPPKLVDLADVEIGKQYEPVVSTYSGLYRYQVGDILQVTGFHNSAPQFKFIQRKNVLLSIERDKTNESDLQKAVENAATLLREFDTRVVDFTSYADNSTIPGHYVIYWELLPSNSPSPTDDVLVKCCHVMEESMNATYRMCRVEDTVGPLEIRVVRSGTFEELMDFAISRGTSINQYKAPKCISYTPFIELLDTRVVSKHLSPAAPYWTPDWRS